VTTAEISSAVGALSAVLAWLTAHHQQINALKQRIQDLETGARLVRRMVNGATVSEIEDEAKGSSD
jgi:hypothetical protein